MNQRDALLGCPALHRFHPTLGDLAQKYRRRNRLAQVLGQETDQSSSGRETGEIAVQIQPVDAFDFQGHVTFEQFVNVGHDHKLYTTSNPPRHCSSV